MKLPLVKGPKKPFKVKTVIFQKIGRVILWTLIIFLILRGIGTLFVNSETDEAQRLINEFVSDKGYRERVELEAAAFAEGFAMEYFTYERGGDYEERLYKYSPSSLTLPSPGYGKTKALAARSYGLEWYSDNQLDVKVAVKVLYELEVEEQMERKIQQVEDEVYIAVPVIEQEGRYMVEDYPAVLPAPPKADANRRFYSGDGVDTAVQNEIKEVLESFFKTYFSGSPGEISYYIHENQRVQGLENRYTLSRLDNVRVFFRELEGEYLALVELTIIDDISKLSHKQGYHVEMIKSNNRYYVKDFKTRTVNIQN